MDHPSGVWACFGSPFGFDLLWFFIRFDFVQLRLVLFTLALWFGAVEMKNAKRLLDYGR